MIDLPKNDPTEILRLSEQIKRNVYNTSSNPQNTNFGMQLDTFATPTGSTKPRFDEFSEYSDNDAYETLNDGSRVAKFENYIPGTNNEERLAKGQTLTEKWGNGAAKLGLKTLTAVAGGTIGVVDSLITGISKGSLSEAYNSDFNVWLDDLNTKLDYNFPNLYTEQEKNAGLFEQMGQANFYADKVFGGLSFMTGALISEGIWTAATGGAGSALAAEGLLARWTAKGLGGEGRFMQAYNTARTLSKGSATQALKTGVDYVEGTVSKNLGKGFGIGEDVIANLSEKQIGSTISKYNYSKIPNIVLTATRSAGYESAFEARLYMKQTENTWLENFRQTNGREPSTEEYSNFKDTLTTSANYVFGANLPLLALSNGVQFSNALFGKTVSGTIKNNAIERTLFGKGFDKVSDATGKTTLKALEATRGQKIFGKVYGVGSKFAMESQEEMYQSVVSGTAENYMLSAYDRDKTKTTYGLAESFYDALEKTYTTKEGLTEGLIGGLIGVLGGAVQTGGRFNEISQEREQIQSAVDYSNKFTTDNHIDNVITNNKMQFAQEQKEQAISKNDLVGEIIADNQSGIARIDRDYAIGGVEEGYNDFKLQVDAINPEDLAKELGFGTSPEAIEQAKEFKVEKVKEYRNLVDRHTKNLQYAEALLGETNFAGINELGDKISTREVQRAIAYSITMGQTASKVNQDMVRQIKTLVAQGINVQGVTDALDIQQILDLAPREKTANLFNLGRKLKNLQNKEKNILAKEKKASKITNREDNIERANTLIDISEELVNVQNSIQNTIQERQLALEALGIENYTDNNITVDMFDNQNQNIEKLKNTIEDIQKLDPQRYFQINKLLVQQSKGVQHIKAFDKTVQAIANPNTRVKLINGWLTKILNKKTTLNKDTKDYFVDMLKNWTTDTSVVFQLTQENKERKSFLQGKDVDGNYLKKLGERVLKGELLTPEDQEIYDNNKKQIEDSLEATIEVPQKENTVTPSSTLDNLKRKVREVIGSKDYLIKYIGDTFEDKEKPSEATINRYEELLKKIDKRIEPKLVNILSKPSNIYDLGLSVEETDELKELNNLLNDWLLLDGVMADEEQSLADLLNIINALETQTVKENTKTDLTDKDYKTVVDASESLSKSLGSNIRGLQTPTTALVTNFDKVYRFSHIKLETFASFFDNEQGKARLIRNKNNKFEVILPTGEILNGKINDKNGQDIDRKDWDLLKSKSNVLIKNFGTLSSAITQFIGNDVDGVAIYKTVEADFGYPQTNGDNLVIDEDKVNSIKNGENLDLVVSTMDAYNANLSPGELESKIHIYVMKDGALLGSLPAPYEDEDVNGIGIPLLEVRRNAINEIVGKTGLIKLNQKIKANISFIGAPNITLERNGDVITTKNNEFNKEYLQNVVGQGYIENGEVKSSVKIDVNQFIDKVSSINKDIKVPFVVFTYNNKNVAFPVNLKSQTIDKSSDLRQTLESTASVATKASVLINTLIENRIDPKSYRLDFSNSEWLENTDKINEVLNDLSEIREYVDVERLASKDYVKENLVNDFTIAIALDNKPFASSKIMLSLDNKPELELPQDENYENADDRFKTLNVETLEFENPYVNEAGVISVLGGIKNEENFSEILNSSELQYLQGKESELFRELSQLNNIPVKEKINGELIDKNSDNTQELLETTLQEPKNGRLEQALFTLSNIDSEIWNSSSELVKKVMESVEVEAIEMGIKLVDFADNYDSKTQEEILPIVVALDNLIKNQTQENQNVFIEAYKGFSDTNLEPSRIMVKVDEKFRDKPMIYLATNDSDYKSFKDNGLIKVQGNTYIKTDSNKRTLEEIENLMMENLDKFSTVSDYNIFYSKEEVDKHEDKYDDEYNEIIERLDKELEAKGVTKFDDKLDYYRVNTEVIENDKKRNKLRRHNNKLLAEALNSAVNKIKIPTSESNKYLKFNEENIKKNLKRRFALSDSGEGYALDFTIFLEDFFEENNLKGIKYDIINSLLPASTITKELSSNEREKALSNTRPIFDMVIYLIKEEFAKRGLGNDVNNTINSNQNIQLKLSSKEDMNNYVESQLSKIDTSDAEYDVDTLKKMIYYQTYFDAKPMGASTEIRTVDRISLISQMNLPNENYIKTDFIGDFRVQQIKEERADSQLFKEVFSNLEVTEEGIKVINKDVISIFQLNNYLNSEQGINLKNYFSLLRNPDIQVDIDDNGIITDVNTERDLYVNGGTLLNYTGEYKRINPETIILKSQNNFVSVNNEVYEKVDEDVFVKLPKNNSIFYEFNNQQPQLTVDTEGISIESKEPEVREKSLLTKAQLKEVDDKTECA